jgi:hypothetical protein
MCRGNLPGKYVIFRKALSLKWKIQPRQPHVSAHICLAYTIVLKDYITSCCNFECMHRQNGICRYYNTKCILTQGKKE